MLDQQLGRKQFIGLHARVRIVQTPPPSIIHLSTCRREFSDHPLPCHRLSSKCNGRMISLNNRPCSRSQPKNAHTVTLRSAQATIHCCACASGAAHGDCVLTLCWNIHLVFYLAVCKIMHFRTAADMRSCPLIGVHVLLASGLEASRQRRFRRISDEAHAIHFDREPFRDLRGRQNQLHTGHAAGTRRAHCVARTTLGMRCFGSWST